MSNSPIHPGAVDWTGENPGIYLKDEQDGPWVSLATFFRITYSPHGRGHGVLLLQSPGSEESLPATANICISDNEPLARFLVDEFFSNFASFKVSPGLSAIQYLPLTSVRREGDTRSEYSEVVSAEGFEVRMTWGQLGVPYAVDMPRIKAHRRTPDVQPVPGFSACINRTEWSGTPRQSSRAGFCGYQEKYSISRLLRKLDADGLGRYPVSPPQANRPFQ